MRVTSTTYCRVIFLAVFFWGMGSIDAAEPVLARLCFFVSAGEVDRFESVYQTDLVPLLKNHDLNEYSEPSRAMPDSVFARLFAVQSIDDVKKKREALDKDLVWQEALKRVGTELGREKFGFTFNLYSAPDTFKEVVPAGAGEVVAAGAGTSQWQIIDEADGLPSTHVWTVFQDRSGNIWLAVGQRGGCRFDGQQFVVFTTEDGLVDNQVGAIFEDTKGDLWFTTPKGASRFDGTDFQNYTLVDGLAEFLIGKEPELVDAKLIQVILKKLDRHPRYHYLIRDQMRELTGSASLSLGQDIREEVDTIYNSLPDQPYRLSSDPAKLRIYLKDYEHLRNADPNSRKMFTLLAGIIIRLDKSDKYEDLVEMMRPFGREIQPVFEEALKEMDKKDPDLQVILMTAESLLMDMENDNG